MNWLYFGIGVLVGWISITVLALLVFNAEESRREEEREAALQKKVWTQGS